MLDQLLPDGLQIHFLQERHVLLDRLRGLSVAGLDRLLILRAMLGQLLPVANQV